MTTLEALSRLRDLGELGLLHQNAQHPDRARLAELATRVAIHMDAPTCMVNAVLPGAVALLAGHGVAGYVEAVGGIPVEWSFCSIVCRTGEPLIIADAANTPVATGNPLVQADGLRAYLGVPVFSAKGHGIGALCVTADRPRVFTATEVASMRQFAGDASNLIEATRRPR